MTWPSGYVVRKSLIRKLPNSLCTDPPSPQETSIFPEGRGGGGSVHRLGHKEQNTVNYFRAAFLAQNQPPYYGLLTQTHFQIAGLYWWRFFFAVYRICWSFSLVPRRPRWFRMCRQLSSLLGEFAISFGSQPLPLTLARTGWLVDEAANPCAVL